MMVSYIKYAIAQLCMHVNMHLRMHVCISLLHPEILSEQVQVLLIVIDIPKLWTLIRKITIVSNFHYFQLLTNIGQKVFSKLVR